MEINLSLKAKYWLYMYIAQKNWFFFFLIIVTVCNLAYKDKRMENCWLNAMLLLDNKYKEDIQERLVQKLYKYDKIRDYLFPNYQKFFFAHIHVW